MTHPPTTTTTPLKMLQLNRNICFIFIDLDSKNTKLLKSQVSQRSWPGDLGWFLHMLSLDRDLWVEEEKSNVPCENLVVRVELVLAWTAAQKNEEHFTSFVCLSVCLFFNHCSGASNEPWGKFKVISKRFFTPQKNAKKNYTHGVCVSNISWVWTLQKKKSSRR